MCPAGPFPGPRADPCRNSQDGTDSSDLIYSVLTTPDNGFVMSGSTLGDYAGTSNGSYDIVSMKLDADGGLEWAWQVRAGRIELVGDIRGGRRALVILNDCHWLIFMPNAYVVALPSPWICSTKKQRERDYDILLHHVYLNNTCLSLA